MNDEITKNEEIIPNEMASPANEFTPCAPEFSELFHENFSEQKSDSVTSATKEQKDKKTLKRKLRHRMSYLVASALAVIVIASGIDDSSIIKNIQLSGGAIQGDLRFSIQWNDVDYNPNDFDAHCTEPDGYDIFFSNRNEESPSGGMLDVDIIYPTKDTPAVENIIYKNKREMKDGVYKLYVHCYSNKGGESGFKAEVSIQGHIYKFNYNKSLAQGANVYVANVSVKNGRISLERLIP